jgi:penicillin amidase
MFNSKGSKILFNAIGILLLLIITGITLYYQFNKLTRKSFYEEAGKKNIPGLVNNVEVVSDEYGVPHITAQSDEDLFFTLGYMHAQDRLWQMDLTRRVAEGRLAEIMGRDVLEYDKLFRTIGIGKYAYTLYQNVSPKTKSILENYSKGVNAFIKENNRKLPFEFDVLNYKPEEWKPEHSLMVVRMMGWELNISWMTEFMFGELVSKFGFEKAKDFFPNYPEDAPYIVKQEKGNTKDIKPNKTEDKLKKISELGKDFYQGVNAYRDHFGLIGTHIGSNSWAVNGKKTEGGKPILANDPHLVLQAPSRWYEVVIKNSADNTMACGFSIPGAPGIAIGSNGTISWGITNLMNDDSDFLVLNRDSTNHDRYIYKNVSYDIDSTEEYIRIKDVKDEVPYTVFSTRLGPVVSNLDRTGFMDGGNFKAGDKYILTFKWTGFEVSDEIKSFYDVYHSNNWEEFRASLHNFGLPASNFTYADVNGNIGYQAAGKIPIRKNDNDFNASIPNNEDLEWTGFVSFDEMPTVYNPDDNFIATANNKPQKDYKYYISNLYEPPYRAARIEEVLKAKPNMTSQEFKLLQNDVVSLQAKEFFKYVLEAFKDSVKMNADEQKIITAIKKWDYNVNKLNGLASLFAEFELQLYIELYKYKLGDKLFYDYIYVNNVPVRNTAKLLKENNSWILGDFKDSLKSDARNLLIRKVFSNAIEKCKLRFHSPDYEKWEWGDIHPVVIRHPLGVVPSLSKILNIGPFEVSGIGTTVANTEYSFRKSIETHEFECFIGASTRFIFDFNEPKFYFSILPSGQSGQPQHTNYSNQTRLWMNGEYKKVYLSSEELKIEGKDVKVLNLYP